MSVLVSEFVLLGIHRANVVDLEIYVYFFYCGNFGPLFFLILFRCFFFSKTHVMHLLVYFMAFHMSL